MIEEECAMEVASAPSGDRRPWSPDGREINPLQASNPEPFSSLSEVDLFAKLSADEIAAFERIAAARTFRNGEIVFSQRGPVTVLRPLGASRESTSKTMADLASRGLIRRARRRIDLDGLAILSKRMA